MKIKKIYSSETPVLLIIKILISVVAVVLYVKGFHYQNWAYFTSKPAQTYYTIYKVHNGIEGKSPLVLNNMSFGMGVSRKGRVCYRELTKAIQKNKGLEWKSIQGRPLSFLVQQVNYDTLYLDNPNGFFSGNFLITSSQRPANTGLINNTVPAAKQYILAVTKVK